MNKKQAKKDCTEDPVSVCVGVFNAFDKEAVLKQHESVQEAWELGRYVVHNGRAEFSQHTED